MPRKEKEKEQLDRAALDGRIRRAASEKGSCSLVLDGYEGRARGELVLDGYEGSDDPVSFDAAELAQALGAGGEAARALTKLYVSSNGLGEAGMAALAAALAGGACPGLTTLVANENELTAFPEALCGVESLEELYLHNNDIDRLPWGLLHLRRLRKLGIVNNRRLRQERKLLGHPSYDNVAALFDYLRDLYGGGEQPARRYRFKLVLAGPTMAGKTSLAAALREGARARLADADTGRTIGLAIKELRMRDPRVRGGGGLLRGNIFDAGGHEQCVPARPPSSSLCMRLCFCRLPHTCGFVSRYHPDPPACAWPTQVPAAPGCLLLQWRALHPGL